MTKRMTAIVAALASGAVAIGACGGSDDTSGDAGSSDGAGEVLRVGMYGGTWTDAVKKTAAEAFEKETGAKVQYVEGNPSDIAAKIYATSSQGADPPVDVIETDTQTQSQLAQRHLLVPTADYQDKAQDVFGNVTSEAVNRGYSPPHCDWYIVFAYNTEKYDELGLGAPKSWSDLFNPKVRGHVSIPDISTAMGIPTLFATGSGDVSAGIEKLSQLETYSVYSSSSDLQADFANGNIWAASSADGRAWQLVDDKQPVKVVYPNIPGTKEIGPLSGSCFLDVVKGTEKTELAAKFIKASYSDRVQAEFAKLTGYTPSSESAVKTLIKEEPVWKDRIPDRTNVAEIDWPPLVPKIEEIVDRFNREIGR